MKLFKKAVNDRHADFRMFAALSARRPDGDGFSVRGGAGTLPEGDAERFSGRGCQHWAGAARGHLALARYTLNMRRWRRAPLLAPAFAALVLAACAPAAADVRSGPFIYAAPYREVFTAVLQVVAADPGLPPYSPGGVNGYRRGASTPWLVVTSDRAAGLIAIESRSRAAGFVGSDAPPDVHQVNILLRAESRPPRTAVSVRGTPFARVFLNRLTLALEERFH